jgi:hypothetical protein
LNPLSIKPQTLSVGVLTRNSGERLAQWLRKVDSFCDEIVVGVDEASDQQTYDIACQLADVVFRFEHTGISAPARLLPPAFASGDWHLMLDDDEEMDERFPGLLPELINDSRYTHYYFPSKWIASTTPPTYFCAPPFYPDWHLRLWRNEQALVWHSPEVHKEYLVQGPGCHEPRTATLHYERIFRTDEERQAKLQRYRAHGSDPCIDLYYLGEGAPQRRLESFPIGAHPGSKDRSRRDANRCRVIEGIQPVANRSVLPPWSARLEVDMPRTLLSGQQLCLEINAVNTGRLAWFPPSGSSRLLQLSYHLRDQAGDIRLFDGERSSVGRIVLPGQAATLLALFKTPQEPGEYLVEWDMVSERECWFADCGSPTRMLPIRVVRSDQPPTGVDPDRSHVTGIPSGADDDAS